MRRLATLLIAALVAGCGGSHAAGTPSSVLPAAGVHPTTTSIPIKHVIVVMQENRSFDNLFHGFPGANTVNFGWGHGKKYVLQQDTLTWPVDLRHDHPQFLEDYDGGKMGGFDAQIVQFKKSGSTCKDYINHPSCWIISGNPTLQAMPYAYVEQSQVQPYWTIAQDYAIGDNTFASNSGPSFPSHQYMIAAESGHASEVPNAQPWGCNAPNNPSDPTWVYVLEYGQANPPEFSKATGHEVPGPYPCFTYPTLADLLDASGITWRYYASSLSNSGGNLSAYMAISQIFNGPDYKKNVIHPDTKILSDIAHGQLQQVSWVTPSGSKSDHAGPDSGNGGPAWVASIVNAVGSSSYWNDTAIIVMWDEWGGWYDHVRPPQYPDPQTGAREGLGFRVPLLIVSPYVKAHYISHNQHEIASTVHFIEKVFGLPYLGQGSGMTYADQRADAFDDMFNYSQKRLKFKSIPAQHDAHWFLTHPDSTPGDDD